MFFLRQPSAAAIQQFISAQQNFQFSYPEVGATQHSPPQGYTVDHNRIKLGEGAETFQRACEALKHWKQFELGWVGIVPNEPPIEVGTTLAVQAQTFGWWSLNAVRIVYVIQNENRFGFAYGTLPDHVERGEERFLIEQLEDGSVWYDLYAFSRPQDALARLGFPIARALQKRFARESLVAMEAEVRGQRSEVRDRRSEIRSQR